MIEIIDSSRCLITDDGSSGANGTRGAPSSLVLVPGSSVLMDNQVVTASLVLDSRTIASF